jgi:hypothetical protein
MQEMWACIPANLHGINQSKTSWAANRFVLTFCWSARETDAFRLKGCKGLVPTEEELSQCGPADLATPLDAAKRAAMSSVMKT